MTVLVIVAFLAVPVAAAPVDGVLRVRGPNHGEVGKPLQVDLVVESARKLAAFEATLSFDQSAARFGGITLQRGGLSRAGQGVQALGPVDVAGGISFGAYSCPSPDCVTPRRGGTRGASGTVRLATLTLIPERAGVLELRFQDLRFAAPDGSPAMITARTASTSITVGSSLISHPAPRLSFLGGRPGTLGEPRTDLNGDGITTQADSMEVAVAWESGRMRGDACWDETAAADVNGDGCVDVSDSQLLVSSFSGVGAQPVVQSVTIQSALTFTVTSVGDTPDSSPGNGVCLATGGGCTLRAAITEANLHPGPDRIEFAIPATGVQTINLTSSLPTISDGTGGTTIDGYTQAGAAPNTTPLASNAVIRVAIRSASETVGWPAMAIASPHNVIRGLSMHRNWRSIMLVGPHSAYNVLAGNFIGTNAAGTYRTVDWNHANGGIYLNGGAHHNEIGQPGVADRNVISGNPASGVYHVGEGTSFNLVRNNIVGLSPSGLARLNNRLEGVDYNTGASDNTVGGLAAGERNVLSGNTANGVEISHGNSVLRTRVIGNFIGTDLTGATSAAYTINSNWGIGVEDGVTDTFISNNVIGNGNRGGIAINGYAQGTTRGTVVRDNLIGISVTGAPIPNGSYGIGVSLDANTIQIGPGNVITNNPQGITLADSRNYAATITRNSIYGNTNLGIDLQPQSGVTPNDFGDADSGANTLLNFPALGSATTSTVTGRACRGCTVEVFVADGGANDYGEGRTFVGSALAGQDGRFSVDVSGVAVGDHVTATSTDPAGNTSEFALNIPVTTTPMSAGTVVATDSFSRTVADRWAAANHGGWWALSGAAADFDVANGVGTIRVGTAGQTRAASLLSVAARDVQIEARVATDKSSVGGNQNLWFVARQSDLGTEYRVRLRMAPGGDVYLNAARVVDNAESYLSADVQVPGLSRVAGTYLNVRAQIFGVGPATIRAKVWPAGSTEPGAWHYTVSDTSTALAGQGAIGVRAFVQSSSSNAPIVFSFDDLMVTAIDAPSPAPTADFTWQQVGGTREVRFSDASLNSQSWAWNFGDGATSTNRNPSHTYSAGATYNVTLTVTGPGGSDSETKAVAVDEPAPPPPTTLAADAFNRTLASGWGSADVGGSYSGGTASFSVSGGMGHMAFQSPGNTRGQYLDAVAAADVDVRFSVASDKVAEAGHQFIYAVARRVNAGTEYAAKIRFGVDNRIYLTVSRFASGAETQLATEVALPGLTHSAGSAVRVRLQLTGANPTTIRVKGWADGTPEPTSWTTTLTDSFAALQTSGSVGLRGYLGGKATNAPITLSFDDYSVTTTP